MLHSAHIRLSASYCSWLGILMTPVNGEDGGFKPVIFSPPTGENGPGILTKFR